MEHARDGALRCASYPNDPSEPAVDAGASTQRIDARPGSPQAQIVPGAILGDRYRVVDLLGHGGMGVVYRVEDLRTQRQLALKTLLNHDPEPVSRFKREWRALADIRHPSLVELHDLFEEQGRLFFTMDLVDGLDFVTFVRRGRALGEPIDVGQARLRSSFIDLVRALDALHGFGKLHRDIKPSNVFTKNDGSIVILDFGLVQDTRRGESATWAGTPCYMSPEQAANLPVGPASDFYSVGVLLYEALTGRLPAFAKQPLDRKPGLDERRPSCLVSNVPADLDAICAALLSATESERPTAQQIAALLGSDARMPSRVVAEAPFVGRRAQLADLQSALERVSEGPLVVFLRGSSGVGKSALVQRFLEPLAHGGAAVLRGRCYERDSIPYKALDGLVEVLVRHLQRLPPRDVDALLPRRFDSLCRVFPAFLRVVGVRRLQAPNASVDDPRGLRHRAALGLRELLGRMSDRRRTLVWIDDAQWGDVDSAALLQMVLDRPDAPPLMLILSYRSEAEPWSPFVRAARSAWADQHALTIDVQPFTRTESAELVAALAPELSASKVAMIADEAHGLPFFAGELVRAHSALASTDDHASLERVLLARVARLGAVDQYVLRLVCVAGRPVSRSIVLAAAATPAETSFARLEAGYLISGHGSGSEDLVEPFHDRVREIVVGSLRADELASVHGKIANALERSGAADPELLAFHLVAAGDPHRASKAMVQAASRAADTLAFDHAASLYRQALELVRSASGARSPELVERSADACLDGGLYDLAAELYEERLRADCNPVARADLLRRSAEVELRSGRTLLGARKLEQMLTTLGFRVPGKRLTMLFRLVWYLVVILLKTHLRRTARASHASAEQDAVVTRIAGRLAEAFYWSDYPRAVFYQLVAIRRSAELTASAELAVTLSQQGFLYASFGLHQSAFRLLDRARTAAEQSASTGARAWEAILRGFSHGCTGDAQGQVDQCTRAEEILRDSVETLRLREAWVIKAEALLALGEARVAEDYGHRLRRLASQLSDARGIGWSLLVLGLARSRQGDWQQAAELLQQAVQESERGGDANYRLTAATRLAFVWCKLGRLSEALELAQVTASEYEGRWLRHNTCCADGVFLAVTGIARLRGIDVPKKLERAAARTLRKRRRFANTLKLTQPFFLAGAGVLLASHGASKRGRQSLEEAFTVARRQSLKGELRDLFVLSAMAAASDDVERARLEAEAVRLELGAPAER